MDRITCRHCGWKAKYFYIINRKIIGYCKHHDNYQFGQRRFYSEDLATIYLTTKILEGAPHANLTNPIPTRVSP